MQFARDAHQAEGWLLTQEPYLKKDEEKNAVCIASYPYLCRNCNLLSEMSIHFLRSVRSVGVIV